MLNQKRVVHQTFVRGSRNLKDEARVEHSSSPLNQSGRFVSGPTVRNELLTVAEGRGPRVLSD